jgi:small subunit ribosomal protein S1
MFEQPTDSASAPETRSGDAEASSTPSADDAAPTPETPASEGDFAALLEESLAASPQTAPRETKVGDRVKGKIVSLGEDAAFVDFGGRAEGALPLAQIKDGDGNLKLKVGDPVEASVTSVDGQVTLALAVRRTDAGLAVLLKAKDSGTPVEGKVKGTNSGGFEVMLGGIRGFCPFSQMDLGPVGDGQQFVGQVHQFKVLDVSEKGRRVVLSRKALLRGERAKQADTVRHTLEVGQDLEGSVTRLLPFGAFVDLGGVQGLVHVSEISHRRVGDPSEALQIGQKVKVKVLKLENLGEGKKERISLSIKASESDPWQEVTSRIKEGDVVRGPVLRVMDFGAFVEISPGVDGLVHVSQLARRRIAHPKDVVSVGQEVEAKITKIDPAAKRISLSMAALEPVTAIDPAAMTGGAYDDDGPRGGGRGGRGGGGHEGRGGRGEGRDAGRRGGKRGRDGGGGGGGGAGRWESRRETRHDATPSDSVFAEAFRRARERQRGDTDSDEE